MTTMTDTEDFVAKYKAALRAKMSRQEFGEYLGIKPESIIRRRLNVLRTTGVDLPYLKNDADFDGGIDVDKIDTFEEIYQQLIERHAGPKIVDMTEIKNHKQVYVITSAQNATPVHKEFFTTLLQYCEARNAELMVIPYRYRNPTSLYSSAQKDEETWWPVLEPYLVDHKVQICKGLQLVGEIKMQPTATTPLSGFDAYTGTDSGIFGHPKIQQKTVATPSKNMPKILATTGACTVPNYTDSKAGHKGRFHHNISAIVVEVDDDKFHMRHIHGEDDGSFYDLDYYYTTQGRTKYGRIAGFVPGDIHAEFVDPTVEAAMFLGDNSIVQALKPEMIIYHDIEDFYRRNHHHRGNDVLAYAKHHFGRNNVEEGLQISADFIDRHTQPNTWNVIVRSNHDEAFDRWLREGDPKNDHENALFYYYMKFHQLRNVRKNRTGFDTFNAFEWWCKNPLDQKGLTNVKKTKFLERDVAIPVAGIEIGFHGDVGLNGGPSSINAYTKIGPKCVIGHSHSPGIVEGAYQVGLSAYLDLEYASGPSSWMHTHCIIYPNGSRALINVVNGEWRASYYDREHEIDNTDYDTSDYDTSDYDNTFRFMIQADDEEEGLPDEYGNQLE